jgi:hypothetical protein
LIELPGAPLVAVARFDGERQQPVRGDGTRGFHRDVIELVCGQVQQHSVGKDDVVRSAEVVNCDVQQIGLVPFGAEPVDESLGPVGAVHLDTLRGEECGVVPWPAAELEHLSAARQQSEDRLPKCRVARRRCGRRLGKVGLDALLI